MALNDIPKEVLFEGWQGPKKAAAFTKKNWDKTKKRLSDRSKARKEKKRQKEIAKIKARIRTRMNEEE